MFITNTDDIYEVTPEYHITNIPIKKKVVNKEPEEDGIHLILTPIEDMPNINEDNCDSKNIKRGRGLAPKRSLTQTQDRCGQYSMGPSAQKINDYQQIVDRAHERRLIYERKESDSRRVEYRLRRILIENEEKRLFEESKKYLEMMSNCFRTNGNSSSNPRVKTFLQSRNRVVRNRKDSDSSDSTIYSCYKSQDRDRSDSKDTTFNMIEIEILDKE